MTQEEAIRNQRDLAQHYNLGWWYGTGCEKCCGVFPKFHTSDSNKEMCWYECEVCGKRTRKVSMPWIAKEEWNAGKFEETQISLF